MKNNEVLYKDETSLGDMPLVHDHWEKLITIVSGSHGPLSSRIDRGTIAAAAIGVKEMVSLQEGNERVFMGESRARIIPPGGPRFVDIITTSCRFFVISWLEGIISKPHNLDIF